MKTQALEEGEVSRRDGRKRFRVQLDFTPDAYERLKAVQALAGKEAPADVVRNALRVYEWYLRKQKDGYRISVVRDGERTDVELVLD